MEAWRFMEPRLRKITGKDITYVGRRESSSPATGFSNSTPIKEYIDQLSDKSMRILIPGCGYGHEAVYLIQKGFSNVHVLDFSPEPLAELAKTELGENISLHCADIFQFEGRITSYNVCYTKLLRIRNFQLG